MLFVIGQVDGGEHDGGGEWEQDPETQKGQQLGGRRQDIADTTMSCRFE